MQSVIKSTVFTKKWTMQVKSTVFYEAFKKCPDYMSASNVKKI